MITAARAQRCSPPREMEGYETHMLVLAVEVSHSPAKPTMSKPVDSWLKNLGWPAVDKETMGRQKNNESPQRGKMASLESLRWRVS